MSTKQEIKKLFKTDLEARKNAIREFVMNAANSHEDRFEVWKECPEELQYIIDLPSCPMKCGVDFHSGNLLDTFERREIVRFTDLPNYGCWRYDEATTEAFFNECMDNGIWGFTYDW